jgi:hypothetical protein
VGVPLTTVPPIPPFEGKQWHSYCQFRTQPSSAIAAFAEFAADSAIKLGSGMQMRTFFNSFYHHYHQPSHTRLGLCLSVFYLVANR